MSFSFGFTGDSDDEFIESETVQHQVSSKQVQDQNENGNPLDIIDEGSKKPKEEKFETLLESLVDIRVTFEKYTTPSGQTVYRRELFDVKHQLMSEEGGERQDDEFKVLMNTDTSDLQKNVYEGGLKSWECSVDTVDKLAQMDNAQLFDGDIVELGCGTALPSTFLFQRALQSNSSNIKFKLSDYNPAVLRLVTIPNLITCWCSTLTEERLTLLQKSEDEEIPIVHDEIQLTKQLIKEFTHDLQQRNISIQLFSGAWNREFLNLITADSSSLGLIITSETIYSPQTLPIISELVIQLVTYAKKQQPQGQTLALVAAKDIYFGVGGSLVDFENYLTKRIQQGAQIAFQTEKVNAGLQRSIVHIR